MRRMKRPIEEKKKAVLFGIGHNYQVHKKAIYDTYDVVALVDNNWEKIGRECQPISILSKIQYDVVVILPSIYLDIWKQLREYGIPENNIVIYMKDIKKNSIRTSLRLNCFGQHFDDLILAAIFGQIGIEFPSYLDLGANMPYEYQLPEQSNAQ